MSKTNTYENDGLLLYFNATPMADLAQNDGSSPATSLYVSLHKADPGETGSRSNECAYTGYAEVAVVRTSSGWVVTGNVVNPAANIDFPVKTAGADEVVTHLGIARAPGGTIDWVGVVTPNLNVIDGKFPRLKTTTVISDD